MICLIFSFYRRRTINSSIVPDIIKPIHSQCCLLSRPEMPAIHLSVIASTSTELYESSDDNCSGQEESQDITNALWNQPGALEKLLFWDTEKSSNENVGSRNASVSNISTSSLFFSPANEEKDRSKASMMMAVTVSKTAINSINVQTPLKIQKRCHCSGHLKGYRSHLHKFCNPFVNRTDERWQDGSVTTAVFDYIPS